jgi:catechol 2,3-dioxygenase-like lactoylglutathione lyase family enzyme
MAFKVDDVDATINKLRAAGVEFFSDVQTVPDAQVAYAGGVRKRLVYFRDPEGNILELCEYR